MKYLGIYIDSHINFNYHISSISNKLSRAIGMLSKVRHFVEKETLRSIYFGIFSSNSTYGCQVWGQIKTKAFNRLESLQNKAIKVINFANPRESVTPLYKAARILKIKDFIRMQHFLYAHIKGPV